MKLHPVHLLFAVPHFDPLKGIQFVVVADIIRAYPFNDPLSSSISGLLKLGGVKVSSI
jgi:hypothetical protein